MGRPALFGLGAAVLLAWAGIALLSLPLYARAVLMLLVLSLGALTFAGLSLLFLLRLLDSSRARRRALFVAPGPARPAAVMLGDSLTQEGLWEEYFPGVGVLNRGIGGDTIADLSERLEPVAALKPRRLFLMIGVNDFNLGAKAERVLADYTALLDRLRRELPETAIYVQSILPVGRSWSRADNAGIAALNDRLHTLAAARGFSFLDLHERFRGEDGALEPALTEDEIHLNPAGYARWCEQIGPLLR